jgi:hypothetical protein
MSTVDVHSDTRFWVGAFCPVHGLFKSSAMALSPGSTFHAVNLGTNCCVRGCTYVCEIIPGLYKGTEHGLSVLIDQSVSKEALAALRTIAENVRDGKITPRQAEEQAKKIAPTAAGIFSNWTRAEALTVAGPIIAALTAIYIAKSTPSPAPSVVIQQVIEQKIERKTDLKSSTSLSRAPRPKR